MGINFLLSHGATGKVPPRYWCCDALSSGVFPVVKILPVFDANTWSKMAKWLCEAMSAALIKGHSKIYLIFFHVCGINTLVQDG
jgi:hypothetical protein